MPSGNRMDKTREEKIKELLVLHLLKELSQEQAGELDSWRKESPENEDLFKRISDPDYLEKRHKDYLEAVSSGKKTSERKAGGLWRWFLVTAGAAAAVFLAVMLVQLSKVKMLTLHAPQKGIASVVLPDGTNVWLKSSSTITYPERFSKDSRDVSLSGEGYFEVARQEGCPFVVSCDAFSIKVLGTKFDIKSYRDENQALAAVIDGEVSIIYADSTGVEKEERMVGGDLSIFDKTSRSNTVVKSNTSIYSSWLGGVYYFESETLESILREVCRYYGYNLILADSVVKDKVLSGRLKMEDSPQAILEAFQEVLPGHVIFESDTIIIQ